MLGDYGDKWGYRNVITLTAFGADIAEKRQSSFSREQMASKCRALRASVSKLWTSTGPAFGAGDIADYFLKWNDAYFTWSGQRTRKLLRLRYTHEDIYGAEAVIDPAR